MTTIPLEWAEQYAAHLPIQSSPPVTIRGVGCTDNVSHKFITAPFHFKARARHGSPLIVKLIVEAHILETYHGPPLLGMDVIVPEGIILDPVKSLAIVSSCDMAHIPTVVKARKSVPRSVVARVHSNMILPPNTVSLLPINPGNLPEYCDFVVDSDSSRHPDLTFYTAVLNHASTMLPVLNTSHTPVRLSNRQRIVTMYPLHAEVVTPTDNYITAYHVSSDTTDDNSTLMKEDYDTADVSEKIRPHTTGTEQQTPEGITVYGNDKTFAIFRDILSKYNVWKDNGDTIDIPEDRWMTVPLIEGWRDILKTHSRGYPASPRDLQVISHIFDKLHQQKRMVWALNPTPFTFPVFVVWKTVLQNGLPVQKGRAVIDIRALNQITQKDLYPLPILEELFSLLRGKQFISVFDGSGWFHQWRVHPKDTDKFTLVSPRGQETMLVAPMGFKNSVAHVQRQIDHELRPHADYARAYVDDTVVFSNTFEDHCRHINDVLATFQRLRASLNPAKSYVGFPSISLLGKKVDGFGLSTPEDKVAALLALTFPKNVKELETYIGMTQWLRHFIPYYASIIQPLQQRKTRLLRHAPRGPARKQYVTKTPISDVTTEEREAFDRLQDCFRAPTFLAHPQPDKPLFLETDASKQRGFGGFIYHADLPPNWELDKPPPRTAVHPVLFLSKVLTNAETKLWPTELEVAAVVWLLKQAYRLIQGHKGPLILYTDHSAIVQLYHQSTMHSSTTDKTNPKLARAAEYMQRFELQIYHRPGRLHIVPDALSRLPSRLVTPTTQDDIIFNLLLQAAYPAYAYTATLVAMSDELRQRFLSGYQDDSHWRPVYQQVQQQLKKPPAERPELPYTIEDDLLYTIGLKGESRLVVPRSLIQDVIRQAHDESAHPGIERTIAQLRTVCIHRLRHNVKLYIRHCKSCLANKTLTHKPFGALQPILATPVPFHTISIDFVTGFPVSADGFDALLTVTCKYTKRVGLIPGASNWDGIYWGRAFVSFLLSADWGIPTVIISDRDSIFLGHLWREIFSGFHTTLLHSTAYHPQTDGQSERTNMTAEIALRHVLPALDDQTSWPTILPYVQCCLNSAKSSTTGTSPHELMYGVQVANPLLRLQRRLLRQPDLAARLESLDLAHYAMMKMKQYYDNRHEDVNLSVGSKVYIRLHKGYKIKSPLPTKLQPQRVGPFTILERVGRLAYRLDIDASWNIHPVLSIAQLEPAPQDSDPFHRPVSPPGPLSVDGDDDHYEIERLLATRESRGRRQYLVKWKGYGDEHNVWYDEADLSHARDLIADFQRTQRPSLLSRLRPRRRS
ncbi:Ribonuclease H-like protein [Ascosphaera apis ARSEF 7405]|uniref:Ribonuclease H-like protein n=1 Tax=Ascosphaera apis ARSEF 7405 TaxID=392613 RepID=A0A167ZTM0_9EURO|nr:Ribonuclease H-like protein [Ascosphaera apis ARSEF 7405]